LDDGRFDVAVIGGGVGGYTAALAASDRGSRVALVEAGVIGGTCLNIGCIPTKTLLESARLIRAARRSREFGVEVGKVEASPEAIAARSRRVIETLRGGVESMLERSGVVVKAGRGRLAAADRIEVAGEQGTETVGAEKVILATGSSWVSLPGIEIDGRGVITSDHALDLSAVGGSMVIVGAGAVGCEMAEVYSALGTEVTVVEVMDQILPGEDSELARRLEAGLKRKGIKVLTGSRVLGVEGVPGRLTVGLEGGRGLPADRVLVAVGRKADWEGVGLEEIGVRVEDGAVSTDGGMRTSVEGILAVGDVTGKHMLAHVAAAQAMVAARNVCGSSDTMDYRAIPRCVYTDPEFAAVGMTEAGAREAGLEVGVSRVRLGQIGRALTLGETLGLAKLIWEKGSGTLIGFHALAPHASELLPEVTLGIQSGMDVSRIASVIHPHPTMSEIIWDCAKEAMRGQGCRGDTEVST
jgi:dihydrolipoamide dehydrogenase